MPRRAACLLVLVSPLLAGVVAASAAAARVDSGSSTTPAASFGSLEAVVAATGSPRREPEEGVWPLRPRPAVVNAFAPPTSPWGPGHRGADLAGQVGQPVRTALPGRVSFVGRVAGRGVVVVDHGATRTTYEPVLGTAPPGSEVEAGRTIGVLSAVGSHCAPRACLHWGWRRGKDYLDPLRLVDAVPQPVRLLPW